MVSYAQETQHEKIIRGLAVGIALVNVVILSSKLVDFHYLESLSKYVD